MTNRPTGTGPASTASQTKAASATCCGPDSRMRGGPGAPSAVIHTLPRHRLLNKERRKGSPRWAQPLRAGSTAVSLLHTGGRHHRQSTRSRRSSVRGTLNTKAVSETSPSATMTGGVPPPRWSGPGRRAGLQVADDQGDSGIQELPAPQGRAPGPCAACRRRSPAPSAGHRPRSGGRRSGRPRPATSRDVPRRPPPGRGSPRSAPRRGRPSSAALRQSMSVPHASRTTGTGKPNRATCAMTAASAATSPPCSVAAQDPTVVQGEDIGVPGPTPAGQRPPPLDDSDRSGRPQGARRRARHRAGGGCPSRTALAARENAARSCSATWSRT
jgi:hypothetical protein